MITSEQIRASRAILRWTLQDLSDKSGVSHSTLKRIEKTEGTPHARIEGLEAIIKAIEETGKIELGCENNTIKIK